MTNNHDMPRMTHYFGMDAIKLAYAMIFTMPGVPFLYYGDEIGMKYQENLVSKEGGFSRTGSRTPMQWNSGKNLGFSASDTPYLPVDTDENAPTVEISRTTLTVFIRLLQTLLPFVTQTMTFTATVILK